MAEIPIVHAWFCHMAWSSLLPPFRRENCWNHSGRPLSLFFINMRQAILRTYCCHKFLLTVLGCNPPASRNASRRVPPPRQPTAGALGISRAPYWVDGVPIPTTPNQETPGSLGHMAGRQKPGKRRIVRYQRFCIQSPRQGTLEWNTRQISAPGRDCPFRHGSSCSSEKPSLLASQCTLRGQRKGQSQSLPSQVIAKKAMALEKGRKVLDALNLWLRPVPPPQEQAEHHPTRWRFPSGGNIWPAVCPIRNHISRLLIPPPPSLSLSPLQPHSFWSSYPSSDGPFALLLQLRSVIATYYP